MSHPFRMDNSSSPSFVSAQSSQQNDATHSSSQAPLRATAGTPTLVVEDCKSGQNREHSPQSFPSMHGRGNTNGGVQSPHSPTESASAALDNITAKGEDATGYRGYPMATSSAVGQGSIHRIMTPQHSDTAASNNSSTRGHPGMSSPAPFLTFPSTLNSSRGFQHSSLLSPTPATIASSSSPPRGMVGIETLAVPVPRHAEPISDISLDSDAQASPLLLDLLDRLARLETSVKDINHNMSGLSTNVSLLLDRTRHLPASFSSINTPSQRFPTTFGQSSLQQKSHNVAASVQSVSEDARMVGNQFSQIGSQVPQLMMHGNSSNGHLAGLGLGAATVSGSKHDSPRIGASAGGIVGYGNHPAMDRNSRLSPRPGASPSPNSRRWTSMTTSHEGTTQSVFHGAMHPPDPSVIVTKWEHLNLHPELLRCILKYGLGPPNKIQQRALPFLLRGSDVIAQAPPTQERIASYVIPVLQLVLNVLRGEPLPSHLGVRGPIALIISTTVDQATQAQRMALGLGSALGVRVHIAAASSLEVSQEATGLIQMQPQVVVGTPQKMMDLFNFLANKTKGAISLSDIRMVVLDEADQLIARNLADYVSTLLRILPPPRTVISSPSLSPGAPPTSGDAFSPFESTAPGQLPSSTVSVSTTERQTAIFSNTVPQDVLNFAQSIHLRESVRVLVRREAVGGAGTFNAGGQTQGSMGTLQSNLSALTLNQGAGAGGQAGSMLGTSPGNRSHSMPSDASLTALRGLRQYYLYVPVSTSGGNIGGYQSPNPNASQISHAIEMKLDVITDLLEDIDFGQAVIYTSSASTHEAVTYKLASKGIEALALHKDMPSTTRQQVLARYRSGSLPDLRYQQAGNNVVGSHHHSISTGDSTSGSKKALVVYDVDVHSRDVGQVPLIVFYDLPRSVEEYKDKVACACTLGSGGTPSRPSVCINVVTGSGGPRGDIEMLRTLECHLGCKMAELPMNSTQLLNY